VSAFLSATPAMAQYTETWSGAAGSNKNTCT